MSDPWDSEQRRPPLDTDADWPERDLWQAWDRPAEPEAESTADTELPWADAEGDELWSDSVGTRPVSSVPWTGPTWDDQPWSEPDPDLPRPDLSAFIGPAEVAELLPDMEQREPEALAERERRELEPEPPAEPELPEAEPEPTTELEQKELEPIDSPVEPEPTPWVVEQVAQSEPADEPVWRAAEPVAAAWTVPEPVPEPEWDEPEAAVKAALTGPDAVAEPEKGEPEPVAHATWTVSEAAATLGLSALESVPEPLEEPAWAPPEPAAESEELTEQAFASFAPKHDFEAVAAVMPPSPEPSFEPELEPELEPEPEPEEPTRPFEPFEVIDGGAFAGSGDATAGEIETSLGAEQDWDGRSERRQPTTAETVVPWLIGLILLLSGMVIVLLALIFTSDNGVLAGLVSPSPAATANVAVIPSADPAASPSRSPAAGSSTPKPTTTPKPALTYGPLEMVYLGRSAALAHIYLLRHDFTADEKPTVLAQDPAQDVDRLAWSPDGTHGAGIIAGRLVAIEEGKPKRALADGIVASTFSLDGTIVYALRIVLGNGTDRAEVLQITYANGDLKKLTEWTYPRPVIGAESAVKEAQFADEGGSQRIYLMNDKTLRIWMLGAPTYGVTTTGRTTKLADVTLPTLWAGDGMKRIELTEGGETTTLILRNPDGGALAKTTAKGLVSHLRWAPDDSQVTFTLGRSVGGGVQQDLFLWDLTNNKAPMQLTNTGAAFGAEWLGASESWRP